MDFADAQKWMANAERWMADAGSWLGTLATTNTLTLIITAATLLAVLVAIWQLRIAIWHLKDTNKTTRGQFWLMLRELMSQYDDIQSNFLPGGKWHGSSTQPDTTSDWGRTESYMGLFEYCNEMIKDGLLDEGRFRDWYKHRVEAILSNPRIVTYELHKNANDWKNFMDLCERLKIKIPPGADNLSPFSQGGQPENIPPAADLHAEFEILRVETTQTLASLRNEISAVGRRLEALEETARNKTSLTK
ncbi:MAG: hypothetical protein ACR652_05595 [Methylocystis sp.]|uniref:hypothetical protein n=1 Tax=Methylocystis sp. TaxID=1911079 RepID=UPI003DA4D5BF